MVVDVEVDVEVVVVEVEVDVLVDVEVDVEVVVVEVVVFVAWLGFSQTSVLLDQPYFEPTFCLQINPDLQSSLESQSPYPAEHLQVGEQ